MRIATNEREWDVDVELDNPHTTQVETVRVLADDEHDAGDVALLALRRARKVYRHILSVTEVVRADACPGCRCLPGDGRTRGCSHPDGCGHDWSEVVS